MKLTLFTPKTFSTMLLPQKCAGQYWISARDDDGKTTRILAVEGVRGTGTGGSDRWVMKSNALYQIVDREMNVMAKASLELLSMYRIRSTDGTSEYRLYAEPLSEDRNRYQAYELLSGSAKMEIGRVAGCDIRYGSEMMSKNHATLYISPAQMMVVDNGSLNGTFVNGRAVQRSGLRTGDVIYTMGMQIIVTNRFLYINNPDGRVSVQSRWLREYHLPEYTLDAAVPEEADPMAEQDYYYRAPRFKRDVEPMELKLDAPPGVQTGDNTPLLMTLGPSLTMGMASATTAAFTVVNAMNNGDVTAAIPAIAMSVGMLGGTLLWPPITKSYQKKAREKKEAARQTAYTEYLQEMEQRVAREIQDQENILRGNDLTTAQYLEKVTTQPLQIWERTPKHTDFLRIRLGSGRLPLKASIEYPQRKFAVEKDPMTEAMYRFGEQERWLNDVPICLNLKERFVSGIYSDRAQLLNYAKSLILQLTALHSYDEMKLVVLYDESDEAEMSFVRWLPHTMDNRRSIRYIATNSEEAKTLSADLDSVIQYRKTLNPDQLKEQSPYYVVLCLDKKLAARAESLRDVLGHKENIGFSVVCMYERLKDLPKECTAVVELSADANGALTLLNNVSELPVPFRVDVPGRLDMRRATQVLANTALDVDNSAFRLPRKYTFLEMLDIGMVEHINLLENWRANDPTKALAAPIGIDRHGEPLMLDLHEKAHGPHGLIAGMTGSGKSETIISYILSMAISYHPSEVAFILIDYKGGGMAKAFENIPHTAGIITNLDGNAINRSLVSMQSELHRRERIFQKVSKQFNISNIDIYKYQKLYREGKVNEPLPHLIIISDEFAELKKDQPDFMTALTSTARVGRSLGVHLILATQKPGGVVDDQIRSNSRFRLCLKVQDRGDSMEMMGRPEAASLVDTGRFYLQVGNNELFEMGQSSWAGAAYHPSAKTIKERDDAISVIDTNGRILAEVNTDRFAGRKDARKQLDVITGYIRKVSDEENIPCWKMWLEPVPAKIYVDDLEKKYPDLRRGGFQLNPIVGEYDDPAHQTQGILTVPLTRDGNVIVYGSAGSGKAAFLEAMCYSMMKDHTPDEVNLYILDFGAETMTAFSRAPHVGDVILAHEAEKVENLFKLMQGKIASRKKLLAQYGGSLEQYHAQTGKTEPNIVVMINNYASFAEQYDGKLEELSYLTREGTKYGIYFVLACTGVNNVRFAMLQNFKCLYSLQLNNTSDYATVLGKTGGMIPGSSKGRGMFRMDKDQVLEFQTARVAREENPYPYFRDFCEDLAAQYPGKQAPHVPVLPETVTAQFLRRHGTPGDFRHVPVGVEKDTLEVAQVDLTARPVHMVLAMNREWKRFTESLAGMLADYHGAETILLTPGGDTLEQQVSEKLRVCPDRGSCVSAAYDIFQQVLTRNNAYKTALASGAPTPEFEPLFVIVQSVDQLKSLMDGCVTENSQAADDTPLNRLKTAMEKSAAAYRVYFIVAESVQAVSAIANEKWYKAQVNSNSGLWIGSGIGSQYRLNVNARTPGINAALDQDFGFVVSNTEGKLVKFLR